MVVRRATRAFTTTTTQCAIPPEAPNYVDVPPSHPPDLVTPRRQKGILPVPRELFPPQQPDKPSADYLARVTRDKKPENVVSEENMSDLGRYRHRLGETRKQYLRESLLDLHIRKEAHTKRIAFRSHQKQAERERLINQPERIDEQLTNATIPQYMRPLNGKQIPPGDMKAAYERKKTNLERHKVEKDEERRDALHTLYMNARNFITTEEQLGAEIDRAFPVDGKHPNFKSDVSPGSNMWNIGAPPTIGDLLEAGSQRVRKDFSKAGLENSAQKYRIDQERMKRIAEELSGGKI